MTEEQIKKALDFYEMQKVGGVFEKIVVYSPDGFICLEDARIEDGLLIGTWNSKLTYMPIEYIQYMQLDGV